MANIIEGLQKLMNKSRELLKAYDEIGPQGAFGAAMIRADIQDAEKAIASGDVVAIVKMYEKLQGHK